MTVWYDGGPLSTDPIRVYLVKTGRTVDARYFIPFVDGEWDVDPLAFEAVYGGDVVVTWPSAAKLRIAGKALGVFADIKAVKAPDGDRRRTITVEKALHY